MTLPGDAKIRKNAPIARGVLDYFPDALFEVADLSRIGNEQHNPGQPMHWAKDKSTDHADCILRHLADRGTRDEDGVRHATKVAWRALALLQIEIERERVPQVADKSERLLVVTEANRGAALTGHHFDRIVVRCPVSEAELGHLKTRLDPGGTIVQATEVGPEPGLYYVHADGTCTFQSTIGLAGAALIDSNGRQISPGP